MVSLEERSTYLLQIKENLKLTAFHKLLSGSIVLKPNLIELRESDEIYYESIIAFQTNDKALFETHYKKKSKSNPNRESPSPFINDDFLIFAFIVGIVKFNIDKTWIKNILSLRIRNSYTITLENIITDNLFSKSNLPEIILIFCNLNNQSLVTNELLNLAYKSVSENSRIFESKNDFHILCSLRAYDLAIELKEYDSQNELNNLRKITKTFVARIKILTWFIQTFLLICFLYGMVSLLSYKPEIKDFFDKISSAFKIFGYIGISQLGNAFPFIKRKLLQLVLQLFGYPKSLIANLDLK